MDPVIGIDLGTTNSAAAFLRPDGPEIIPNAVGGRLTPSVVGVDESGAVLVGAAAKELQVLRPERCAGLFKRYMGTDRKLTVGGARVHPGGAVRARAPRPESGRRGVLRAPGVARGHHRPGVL